MRIPVQIIVKSTVCHDQGEEEHIEFSTTGEFLKKEQAFYLTYQESQEVGNIKTVMKISGGHLLLIRSGAVRSRQLFQKGKKTYTYYETPYGSLRLAAETKRFRWHTDGEKHGTLNLEYLLEIEGDQAHLHRLAIQFKKEDEMNEYRR